MAQPQQQRRMRFIAGADSFGKSLKDTLVSHLRGLNIEVQDVGTNKYYSVGAEVGRRVSQASDDPSVETRGLVACGTGVGVAIFANKFPGVYAATCLSPEEALNARSINNSNVLAVSGTSTDSETAINILQTFLHTPFKSPCPASGSTAWPPEIDSFLEASVSEMSAIGKPEKNFESESESPCLLCSLAKERKEGDFTAVDIMPGASMKIIRENPTSAIVRFTAGAMEPAHHHTYGHDLVVIKGKKTVWNMSNGGRYDLVAGDFLYTPAGDVHRVKYHEDTEFFIKWDGHWDIFLDEDLAAAHAAAAAIRCCFCAFEMCECLSVCC